MISAPGGAPGIDSSIHTSALAGGAQMALLRDGYYNHFARGADPRGPTSPCRHVRSSTKGAVMTITHAVAVLFRFTLKSLARACYPTLKVYSPEGWCLNVRSSAWRKASVVR